jgi:hypothetical protein
MFHIYNLYEYRYIVTIIYLFYCNSDNASHAEMGLDDHIDTIYRENDMDPLTAHVLPEDWRSAGEGESLPGTSGRDSAGRPEAFVLFEHGAIEQRIVHDEERVEQRRVEREQEALAQRYSAYAQTTDNPVTFEQFMQVMKQFSE